MRSIRRKYVREFDGKVRSLTDLQYQRQFRVYHNGKIYEKGGWKLLPEEPKTKAGKDIVADAEKPRRGRKPKNNGGTDK
jgi:hypothetical protein